jgi:GH24 family phage-related lysozyme (muramidase)
MAYLKSEEEASAPLSKDLAFHIEGIKRNITAKLTQAQFDTLVDISFNTGRSALMQSQIVRLINQGKLTEAAEAIKTFRSVGLIGRRTREYENFLRGNYRR